jgi:hypothetical protein
MPCHWGWRDMGGPRPAVDKRYNRPAYERSTKIRYLMGAVNCHRHRRDQTPMLSRHRGLLINDGNQYKSHYIINTTVRMAGRTMAPLSGLSMAAERYGGYGT